MVKSCRRAARTHDGRFQAKPGSSLISSAFQTGELKAIPWHAAISLQTWLVQRFLETDP
jgi:hypothetical protein